LLSACGGSEDKDNVVNPEGLVQRKAGISGLLRGGVTFAAVAADESRAAEVGRDVLRAAAMPRTLRSLCILPWP